MVISVRTERGRDGLEIVKEADTDVHRVRLRHEAQMLTRAAHPGVVELTSSSSSVLRLRHRGTSLARLGALPPDHVAAMVRSVAEVVDVLHRQGVAHTRIDREHVVVGDRGRPRLCGFAEATNATDELRAEDVAGLGRLLDELLDASGETLWSPVHRGPRAAGRRRKALKGFRAAARAAQRDDPGQRPTARQFATALQQALPDLALPIIPTTGSARDFASLPADIDPTADIGWSDDDLSYLTAADDDDDGPGDPFAKLAALTDRDPTPEPRARPDGQPATDQGSARADDAATPAEPAGDPLQPIRIRPSTAEAEPPPATGTRRRTLVLIAIVVLVIGAVAGVLIARAVQPFDSDAPAAAPTRAALTDAAVENTVPAERTTSTTSAPASPTPPEHPDGCTVPPVPGPDIDGDGCPEPVTVEGRIATVGDRRVELGQDGDLAVVADHDCDGVATPVLLRPGSGELFVFTAWSLDEAVEVDATDVVPDATGIATRSEPCPTVVVTDSAGAEHVVASPET